MQFAWVWVSRDGSILHHKISLLYIKTGKYETRKWPLVELNADKKMCFGLLSEFNQSANDDIYDMAYFA